MTTIKLSNGVPVVVDDKDYEWLNQFGWNHIPDCMTAYARRRRDSELMHRLILEAPTGVQVDHRNGDGLDNRRSNLRLATQAQNMQNKRPKRGKQYKGVWRQSGRSGPRAGWRAGIRVEGVWRGLGSFADVEEAARAYDDAAREAFGEFARTNFN